MKRLHLSDIVLILMKTTKFCKQKCYFLTFFQCFAVDPLVHELILLCLKTHQGSTRQIESVNHRAGLVVKKLNE